MDWNIAGDETYDSSTKRITILKKNAKELLTQLAATKNTDVMLVPFGTTLKKKIEGDFSKFYSASTEQGKVRGSDR